MLLFVIIHSLFEQVCTHGIDKLAEIYTEKLSGFWVIQLSDNDIWKRLDFSPYASVALSAISKYSLLTCSIDTSWEDHL